MSEPETESDYERPENYEDQDHGLIFKDEFKKTAMETSMNATQITAMLKLFKKFNIGYDLPSSSRTLLNTPRNIIISKISDVDYYNFGVEKQIIQNLKTYYKDFDNDIIYLTLNIDGIPFYKSSKSSCWPILLCSNISPETVYPVAITHGADTSKPNGTVFIRETLIEIKSLEENGLHFNGKHIRIKTDCIVCDAPARAMVKCVKGHAGYYACDRCTQKGDYREGRVIFPELDAELRTNDSFRSQLNEEHHLNNSEFLRLDIDMVHCFSIDYMHAVCLGVMKRLLHIWLGKDSIFNHRIYRISNIREMNSRIELLIRSIPGNIFARKPRKIDHVSFWKATEFRLFLLYTGHIILKELLPSNYYNNFLCLNFSMLILLNSNSTREQILYAQHLLRFFINVCESLYGNFFSIYNVHMLLHIADDRLKYKNLDYCSSFKFENYLGIMKSLINSGFLPLKQLINRIEERKDIPIISKIKLNTIRIGNIYIISENQACKILNNDHKPLCKIYNLTSQYTYPCDSSKVGIYSATPFISKCISRDNLVKLAIIIDCDTIYDNGDIIIQAIQHLF